MPSAWTNFPCRTVLARWRYLDDGHIELEGHGIVSPSKWPSGVNQWKAPIAQMSAKYRIPEHWIASIMAVESRGDPKAVSSAGAIGLMQLMPATGRLIAKNIGRPVTFDYELAEPGLNLEIGVAYLADLLKRYGGDFMSAAVGYNAGSVICLETAKKCTKGYWGVCTDGSPYPLWVLQGANGALANGFGPTIAPPELHPVPAPRPVAPWVITSVTAVGAFLAYKAYEELEHATRQAARRRAA